LNLKAAVDEPLMYLIRIPLSVFSYMSLIIADTSYSFWYVGTGVLYVSDTDPGMGFVFHVVVFSFQAAPTVTNSRVGEESEEEL
jgi:hypothetical protein